MLLERTYKPKDEELIYHYCDANTFYSICTNRTIRLSDIYSMNDFLELHWGYSIWERAATEVFDIVGQEFLDKIDYLFHTFGVKGSLTSACFSKNGDVLSQWRAYANDGKGYAIGFKAKDLVKLPIRAVEVLYNEAMQIEEFKKMILTVHEVEKTEKEKFGIDFYNVCFNLACDLSSLKNPAFEEEQEIRLIHVLNFESSNESLKLIDVGGTSFDKKIDGQKVEFRMRDNTPVPYIDIDFTNSGEVNPIKEVILGPKNDSVLTGVSVFLETIGIGSVEIKKSLASYR